MRKCITLSFIAALMLLPSLYSDDLDNLLDLNLEELVQIEINEVFGASKITQKLTDAPANITIISNEEIQRNNYRTLAEALSMQSGFYSSYDRDFTFIGVRGFSSPGDYNSKVLTLIDGQRTNENVYASSVMGSTAYVDMDLIDHIEVIRGPGSALYGSNALFAVINIITKDTTNYGNGKVAIMLGNYGTDEERVTLSHTFDNSAQVLLSATRYHSDGEKDLYFKEFDTPATNNGHAQNIDSEDGYKLFLKSNYKDFTLEALFYDRKKDVPTASWATVFNTPIQVNDQHGFAKLSYRSDISDAFTLDTSLAFNHYSYSGIYTYEDSGHVDSVDTAKSQWIDGSIDLNYKQSDKLHWLIGFYALKSLMEAQSAVYNFSPYFEADKPVDSYAFYVQNIYNATNKLSFTTGVRLDNYESTGSHISPKLSAIYALTPVTSLKAVYGKAFRVPSAYELYYYDGGYTSKASTNLEEEYIQNYELMFEHYFSTTHSLSINAFHYKIENLIQFVTDPADGLINAKNIDEAESRGIELSHKYTFANDIGTSLNYTYQKAINSTTKQGLVNSPKNMANASISIPFKDNYTVSTMFQYVGEKKHSNGEVLDDYLLTNVSLNAYEAIKGWDLSATLYNLFDENYASIGSEEHVQTRIRQNGIALEVKAIYKF